MPGNGSELRSTGAFGAGANGTVFARTGQVFVMDGKELYAIYEASGPQLLPSWEALTNDERWRYANAASRLRDVFYDEIESSARQEIRESI